MNEIKCPHCGKVFQVDESGYAEIVNQVKNVEFEKELHQIKEQLSEKQDLAIQNAVAVKEKELAAVSFEKDQKVLELSQELKRFKEIQPLEIQNALQDKEKELTRLQGEMEKLRLSHENELTQSKVGLERERDELAGKLSLIEKEKELEVKNQKELFEKQLQAKEEEISFYKDFKAKQSTKMIGESLENYCYQEFNKIRAAAYPNAYFEKDNDARSGSKGDFIFKDFEDDVEYISIMFEMKNEADTTSTKHKNRHFLKELDKDRREKGCEYAVLVSMLEAEDEFYNTGIVEMYEYEKMYVVRPQFFLQVISLLRNAAKNSLETKKELKLIQEQNIDITHFEEDLQLFKDKFAKNYQSASTNFAKAIEEIDKSIARMEAVKKALTTSENQLRLANQKLDDVSVKKLTRKNPTMKAKFEALVSVE